MTLFKNKYRIESTRLKGWDYASAGWYFVTICTRGEECFFGDVISGEMRLSPIGEIVADEWQRTPTIRGNVELDEWIVMPNHVHGIIVINDPVETPRRGVSTPAKPSRLQPNSLGSIIGQIKTVCTKRIHASGCREFDWQARFHDEILRDERAADNIRKYIVDNPAKWGTDKENPAGLWM
jgi:putative transposase